MVGYTVFLIYKFYIHRFNQPCVENIEKNPRKSSKAKLDSAILWHLYAWCSRRIRYCRRQSKYTEAVRRLHANAVLFLDVLERPQSLVPPPPRGSWAPSPVDVEGQLCDV